MDLQRPGAASRKAGAGGPFLDRRMPFPGPGPERHTRKGDDAVAFGTAGTPCRTWMDSPPTGPFRTLRTPSCVNFPSHGLNGELAMFATLRSGPDPLCIQGPRGINR